MSKPWSSPVVRATASAYDVHSPSQGNNSGTFYYAFGETDVVGVFEIPDAASAAALSLMINATGAVRLHLKPLMTVEDLDEAAKKTPAYRAPGQ